MITSRQTQTLRADRTSLRPTANKNEILQPRTAAEPTRETVFPPRLFASDPGEDIPCLERLVSTISTTTPGLLPSAVLRRPLFRRRGLPHCCRTGKQRVRDQAAQGSGEALAGVDCIF